MWQLRLRTNSTDAMALLASTLDARDVAAVSAYYQQLRPGQP
jgi:cytochrome c553